LDLEGKITKGAGGGCSEKQLEEEVKKRLEEIQLKERDKERRKELDKKRGWRWKWN
jgi:hypothetical protein